MWQRGGRAHIWYPTQAISTKLLVLNQEGEHLQVLFEVGHFTV